MTHFLGPITARLLLVGAIAQPAILRDSPSGLQTPRYENAPSNVRTDRSFDVISIRPSDHSVTSGGFHRIDPGVITISGMTVKELISTAYSLRAYQIDGGPKWVDTERYDVAAKDTSAGVVDSHSLTKQQWIAALTANYEKMRTLLADRFGLKVHTESRELPAYALRVARPDKLHGLPCGEKYYLQEGFAKGRISIQSLVAVLSNDMDRPVVDATGLKDCYDVDLKWTLDPDNDEVPSISTALQSLGLKLASTTRPTEVLVIDQVTKPSPN